MKFIFEQVFAQRKDNGKKIFMNRCSCPASYGAKNLLCVHGLTSSNHVFDLDYKDYSVARYFARNGYTVWCMDYGGYGLSDKYENGFDVDTQNAAEDIIAAAEEICARQHVSALNLIGWSWGSMTSARASAARPELFHKMSWVGPCFGGTLPVTEVKDPFTTLSYPYCVRVFQRVNNSDTEVDYTTVEHGLVSLWVEQVFKIDAGHGRPNGGNRDIASAGKQWLIDPEKVGCPVLLNYGDNDVYVDEARVKIALEKLPAGSARNFMKGAGHALWVERDYYKTFREHTLAFFEEK